MYLEHFGLSEPPFRITPTTSFFFSGASRGEILDALIYSISEIEGIVKITGEVGSGKSMLCQMLLKKLPANIEAIYLANPSLSREEMLYAIADGLGLNINGERVGIIMQSIQNRLQEKAREGKRVAVLVDEAHAMPPDTLEELRLLYNLQAGNAKLLQLVLFGQPELDAKLAQPNMRQLKDRIVHHFSMQPLSRSNLESYLMFRMRAANYHGPNIFSPKAIKLIKSASGGLMRRVNILADKSLLAAFIENTHNIEARHVQAAMRDSNLRPAPPLRGKGFLIAGGIAALAAGGIALGWLLGGPQPAAGEPAQSVPPATAPAPAAAPAIAPIIPPATAQGDSGQPQGSPPAAQTAAPRATPEKSDAPPPRAQAKPLPRVREVPRTPETTRTPEAPRAPAVPEPLPADSGTTRSPLQTAPAPPEEGASSGIRPANPG